MLIKRLFSSSPASTPRIIRSVKEYRDLRQSWYAQGSSVGFVPTMIYKGALHAGHLKLAETAKKMTDKVVVSIFVNPSQFAPHEDLAKYPRTEKADVALLSREGVDVVFIPPVQEMYPSGITLNVKDQIGSFVSVEGLSHQLEGSVRPHFFRGVATILTKLFNAIQPTAAFFGQKDVQQCVVTKNMIRDLLFPIDLVIVPTMREADGLAMSSRNRYLSDEERAWAPLLYKGLQAANKALSEQGIRDRQQLIDIANRVISLEKNLIVEYLSIADPITLAEVERVTSGAIFSGAMKVGKIRIIDNLLLDITVQELGLTQKRK